MAAASGAAATASVLVVVVVVVRVVVTMHSLADAKHVTVRMFDVHLTDTPGFVPRRSHDLETFAQAARMHGIHIVGPDSEPHGVGAAPALPVTTQADLHLASANGAE